jgi:hypothetical protein
MQITRIVLMVGPCASAAMPAASRTALVHEVTKTAMSSPLPAVDFGGPKHPQWVGARERFRRWSKYPMKISNAFC